MGFKIVVVDRSPSALKAAEIALPAPEFEVATFGDGLEAIRAIPDLAPDAVLAGGKTSQRRTACGVRDGGACALLRDAGAGRGDRRARRAG